MKKNIDFLNYGTVKHIKDLLRRVDEGKEPYAQGVCYPQADDVEKVNRLVISIFNGQTSKEDLGRILNVTLRQVDYYGNAAVYLGFLQTNRGQFQLTELGKKFAQYDKKQRENLLIEQFFKIPSIRKVFRQLLPLTLDINLVMDSMARAQVNLNTKKMQRRRAQTIHAWVNWALENMEKTI
ncbi:MAG: AAA-associated domain-containing protein [Candidatus Omnitrophota bacterium]